MAISFQLEGELEEQLRRDLGDLGQAAREALLIEAYRKGKLSVGRLARTLGMGVIEADQWLADRGVPLNYTFEDFQADVRSLEELRGPTSR
ncbi:MAG TPA: UPF0175 family protein [Phycisphaerae bacterium]|nr:UPF0175 family protein [Phycisphaerae bacterium]